MRKWFYSTLLLEKPRDGQVCVLVHFGNWAGLVDVMFKKNKSGQLIEW